MEERVRFQRLRLAEGDVASRLREAAPTSRLMFREMLHDDTLIINMMSGYPS